MSIRAARKGREGRKRFLMDGFMGWAFKGLRINSWIVEIYLCTCMLLHILYCTMYGIYSIYLSSHLLLSIIYTSHSTLLNTYTLRTLIPSLINFILCSLCPLLSTTTLLLLYYYYYLLLVASTSTPIKSELPTPCTHYW